MIVLRGGILLAVLSLAVLLAFHYWPSPHGRPADGTLASSGSDIGSSPAAPLGQFSPLDPPRPAPEASFAARDGTTLRLADFRGRWLLVNLWATWCAPCLREMPSLDRLQKRLGERLTVLAISQDRGGKEAVEPFLAKLHLEALATYLDPKGAVGRALGIEGLPTSFLIDAEGLIRGRLEGAAAWDSPEMLRRLERYLEQPDPKGGIVKTSARRF
jgi:thiol-disulfide isomerase/thioredoxin